MDRREFITLLGGTAASPRGARAQESAMPVIGYLGLPSADADAYLLASFRKALSEAGFDEGRNFIIDYRSVQRDVTRLPTLAADLVARKVKDVVGCGCVKS